MKPILVALLLTPVVLGAAGAPAQAERVRPVVAGLPPVEIVAILRAEGFEPLGRPGRGAGVFFVRALDPTDNDVRLILDARTGRILEVRSMTAFAPAYRRPVHGHPAVERRRFDAAIGFEDATGALPVPPRAVPGGSAALGRTSTLPLPRPRPQAIAAAPPSQPAPANQAGAAATKPAEIAPAAADGANAPGKIELPPVTPLE